jgi:CubicO group peptidase (beta-lactamase class C family)
VIVLHEAYGERDGEPMTVETPSWTACITKIMSSTLLMTMVDQGLVDPDAAVGEYLPAFEGRDMDEPLRVRHLYTHTSGLWGHWGAWLHDFDQVVGTYSPYLEVGERYSYNGAGLELGSKILELVSGEALPLFYRNHLLGPLGMDHTEAIDSGGATMSTPLDMAKLGQMLLNRGSYGNMRFFSQETFEKMLPRPLTAKLGPDAHTVYGFGCTWFEGHGLGEGTFGHGAASSATLRINPEHKLVIVICRNRGGRNFGTYHGRFLETVTGAIED